jgi:hypothetical protein
VVIADNTISSSTIPLFAGFRYRKVNVVERAEKQIAELPIGM